MSSIAKIRKNFQEFEKLYILFCDTKPLPAYYIKFHAVMKGMKQIGSNTTDPEIVEFRKQLEQGILILEKMKKDLNSKPQHN